MHDESYIQIALELAKKGRGVVSPAPLTGSLIVKNNKIIGAAYRSCPAEEPAEIIAIKNSKESVDNAILYTNLEPCGVYKNETDCADEIISSKIKKIVIGTANPNQHSGGSAIKKFKKAGIEVKLGVLEKECIDVNKFYFKFVNGGIPYTALKMVCGLEEMLPIISC